MIMPSYDARILKRKNQTQRRVTENRNMVREMCKALNEKTRIEIALKKYLLNKGVTDAQIDAALKSVKAAQQDEHFHLLWSLLDEK